MKTLKLLSLLFIGYFLFSCEENNVQTSNDNTLTASTARYTNYPKGQLFTYRTDQELADKLSEAFVKLAEEDNLEIQSDTKFNYVFNKIKVAGGVALFAEKYYIDETRGIIVRSLLLNTDGEYIESNVEVPNNNSSTNCPLGYNSVGSCSYGLGEALYKDCVRVKVGNYSMQHSAPNECTEYNFSNTQTGTNICARSCN